MSYIYGAPILDVSRSHTMTQHRPNSVWKYNVRMDIRVIGCKEGMWMDLAEDVV